MSEGEIVCPSCDQVMIMVSNDGIEYWECPDCYYKEEVDG